MSPSSWSPRRLVLALLPVFVVGCAGGIDAAIDAADQERLELGEALATAIDDRAGGRAGLTQPVALADIPADPANPITEAKVELGQLLFHDTALAVAGVDESLSHTYSCASCHQVAAGFKAGIDQGIGEGGDGFDDVRIAIDGFDDPDVQPFASPTIINTAFQDVMLWNGQFGNADGSVNHTVDLDRLATDETPKATNLLGYEGVETQAIAGLGVHRLTGQANDALLSDGYQGLLAAAFPGEFPAPRGGAPVFPTDEQLGLAIAAYERTVIATESPFQRWLRGERRAMSPEELRGALVFFGPAGCADCHTGPGLSSPVDSVHASELFQAVGFADLDDAGRDGPAFLGTITDADRLGRGGLTGEAADAYAFKVPTLYNLADAEHFGHGASFDSIGAVVDYFLAALPQNTAAAEALDPRFVARPLSTEQRSDLIAFLTTGLHDPSLDRFVPEGWPDVPVTPG